MRGEKIKRLTWPAPDGGALCVDKDEAIERLYTLENIFGDEEFEYELNELARLVDLADFLRMITDGDMAMLERLKDLWKWDKKGEVFVGADRGGDPGPMGKEGYIPPCDHIAGLLTDYDYWELGSTDRVVKYIHDNRSMMEPYKKVKYWAEHVDYECGEIILFRHCPKCGEKIDWGSVIKEEKEGEKPR